jgi:hypothetical protein
MKLMLIAALSLAVSAPAFAKSTYVRSYTKKDGSYVQGHYRSSANNTSSDNWSTEGNSNPYTGAAGTKRNTDSNSGYFYGND